MLLSYFVLCDILIKACHKHVIKTSGQSCQPLKKKKGVNEYEKLFFISTGKNGM